MQVSGPTAMPGFVVMRKGSTTVTGYLGDQTSILLNRIALLEQRRVNAKAPSYLARLDEDLAKARSMLASTSNTLSKVVH